MTGVIMLVIGDKSKAEIVIQEYFKSYEFLSINMTVETLKKLVHARTQRKNYVFTAKTSFDVPVILHRHVTHIFTCIE